MEPARSWWTRYGLVVKALAAALVLVALKAAVGVLGYEFVSTLPLFTGLMGAVVFTLAILLSGVLADFKESERLIVEVSSQIERLDRDLALVFREPAALAAARVQVADLARTLHASLASGRGIRMRDVDRPLRALDADTERAALAGATPNYVLLVRGHVASTARMAQRLESIIETTFVSSAYAVAGLVVSVALGVFAVTSIEPRGQGLLLYGFGAFLLVALFLLISDLDNPFGGHARVDLKPLTKLVARLQAPPSAPSVQVLVAPEPVATR